MGGSAPSHDAAIGLGDLLDQHFFPGQEVPVPCRVGLSPPPHPIGGSPPAEPGKRHVLQQGLLAQGWVQEPGELLVVYQGRYHKDALAASRRAKACGGCVVAAAITPEKVRSRPVTPSTTASAAVAASSSPMRRLYPWTSVLNIVASLRSIPICFRS